MDTETTYGAPAICHVNNWSSTDGTSHGTTATELVTMSYAQFDYGWSPTATFAAYGTTVDAATYGVTFYPANGTGRVVTMDSNWMLADF